MKRLGSWIEDGVVHIRTWAPGAGRVSLIQNGEPRPMTREANGLWFASFPDPGGDMRWRLQPDGDGPYPDPLSGAQPDGVHGASALDRTDFPWTDDDWKGVSLKDLVVYELHVGAATREGTFDALIGKLDAIRELGVTAIELMPVASFPGRHNWGYDGVFWQAPFAHYGGPEGLRKLVDAAHERGLGVLLDVVLNHFGPDGNYLWVLGREAFTDRFKTPWGEALDWTNPVVREIAFSTAERWIRDFHIDGLRLDATHALRHEQAHPSFLRELAERARQSAPHRHVVVIAEDERNEARLIRPVEQGGDGLDGVWADDFHHAMRRLLAGDSDGYYADYGGTVDEVVRALRRGWIYEGQFSKHQNTQRGTSADGLSPTRFVHCLQNHDQIGNRPAGDRLGFSVGADALMAATAVLLLSPHVPLLFMGQEWNAGTPFPYFTDHEPELGRRVTKGRRREFASFHGFSGEVPDPQAPATFASAKLDWTERDRPEKRKMLEWHRRLLELRKQLPDSFELKAMGPHGLLLERGRFVLVVSFDGPVHHTFGDDVRILFSSAEFSGRTPIRLHGRQVDLGGTGAVVLESA